ncbi:hypothetical protein [Desulfopila aestuarii]|uniref:Ethanolamine utilization protein n=1 Tax=Desulfopila aestuarii DSM 18488 TaxID=1121416 RepID=A0A1M7YJN0_9BACT|nr:hypothetical protein [Desulfopila aestuarii]SHO52786.1 ethanolamine utilization protein [Desulfopila aestuarii DSM 18488]
MHVDKELVARLVDEIVGRLTDDHGAEHVLVIGSRNVGNEIFLPSDNAANRKIFFYDESYDNQKIDRYVLPSLQINDMADLALGRAVTPVAEMVRSLLLSGKKVEVLNYVYMAHESTAPPKLYQLYSEYAETLHAFGLAPVKEVRKLVCLTNRIISEKDLKACRAGGIKRIAIYPKTIVTSLAEDYARQFGIEIQRSERGA